MFMTRLAKPPDWNGPRPARHIRPELRRIAALLTFLAPLPPRREMALSRQIQANMRSHSFEDSAYAALREIGWTDRSARNLLLAVRRTPHTDPRHRHSIEETMRRLLETASGPDFEPLERAMP